DTGVYQDFKSLVISGTAGIGDDEGATFTGPTDPSKVAQIQALGFTSGALIDINQGDFTTFTHLTLAGGTQYGAMIRNNSTNNVLTYITKSGATADGINVDNTSTPLTLNHLDVSGNGANGLNIQGVFGGVSDSRVYNNLQTGILVINTGGPANFEA